MRVRPSMVMLALLATTAGGRAEAQDATPAPIDSAKSAAIHELLTVSGSVDQAFRVMESSISSQREANPAIPAVFWDRFIQRARERRSEFEALIAGAYANSFSTEEIRQLIAFYRTPIGRRLLEVQPTIARESIAAGQAWGRRVGEEVARELAAENAPPP